MGFCLDFELQSEKVFVFKQQKTSKRVDFNKIFIEFCMGSREGTWLQIFYHRQVPRKTLYPSPAKKSKLTDVQTKSSPVISVAYRLW